jgi:hypothetical protein
MSRDGTPRVELTSAEPRIFGLVPPALALVLGLAALIAGIVAMASGGLPAGIVLLICGAILLALAVDAARRWPTSAVPRLSLRVAEAIGSRIGFVRASAGTWSGASREVVRMRRELRALRSDREAELSALGEAAYTEDGERMAALRRQLNEIDQGIDQRETRIAEVMGAARQRVKRERAAVPTTRTFAVPEIEPSPGTDGDTRPIPTAERSRSGGG